MNATNDPLEILDAIVVVDVLTNSLEILIHPVKHVL